MGSRSAGWFEIECHCKFGDSKINQFVIIVNDFLIKVGLNLLVTGPTVNSVYNNGLDKSLLRPITV